MTTKFKRAMSDYTGRARFHDSKKLAVLIEAAREEERAKFPALFEAAKAIVAAEAEYLQ